VDGVVVSSDVMPHPELEDVFTMGECITESFPSDFSSADTTRSVVMLYYGSFAEIAREHADFDWDHEIWETLTHELQHHLESLAGDDTLGDMDYAANENFKRLDGDAFDPFFYRVGESLPDRVFRVEDEIFIERTFTTERVIDVDVNGRDVRVRIPELGTPDVAYITVVDAHGPLHPPFCLVLVRELTGLRAIGALLRPRPPVLAHAEGSIE
jgi:hypothetical protein